MVPCLPFMAIGIVAALRALHGKLRARATTILVLGDVVCAVALMPVWLGLNGSLFLVRALHLFPR
jgi:hypothetical protein